MVEAVQVEDLRQRHTALTRGKAELDGRLQQRKEHHALLMARMSEEYGCTTLAELETKIGQDAEALAEATTAAEDAVAAAEAAIAAVGDIPAAG
tara:strand:- start:19 stop:300 length:282 start_codon:yes stop_codon:yes gene_type:complete